MARPAGCHDTDRSLPFVGIHRFCSGGSGTFHPPVKNALLDRRVREDALDQFQLGTKHVRQIRLVAGYYHADGALPDRARKRCADV
jgi:hypothetical protein